MLYVTNVLYESWKNDQEKLKSPSGEENYWTRHVSRKCLTERQFSSKAIHALTAQHCTTDEALGVCNVIYSERHVLYLDVWKFAGNGNLRQTAQKLEIGL
jgi:hypothetical protein